MDINPAQLDVLADAIVDRLSGDLDQDNDLQQYHNVVMDELVHHRDKQVEHLKTLIKQWEEVTGQDDTSLYSLGLRHAVDILRGVDPTGIRHTPR